MLGGKQISKGNIMSNDDLLTQDLSNEFLHNVLNAKTSEKEKVDITSRKFEKFLQDTLNKYNSQKDNPNFGYRHYYEYLYTQASLKAHQAISNFVNLEQIFLTSRDFNKHLKTVKLVFKNAAGINIKEQNIKAKVIEIFDKIKKEGCLLPNVDRLDPRYFTNYCKANDVVFYDATSVYLRAYFDYLSYISSQYCEFMDANYDYFESLYEDFVRSICKNKVEEARIKEIIAVSLSLFISNLLFVYQTYLCKLVSLQGDAMNKIQYYVTRKMREEGKEQSYIDDYLARSVDNYFNENAVDQTFQTMKDRFLEIFSDQTNKE